MKGTVGRFISIPQTDEPYLFYLAKSTCGATNSAKDLKS